MDFKLSQLVVILSAFTESEVYGNIKFILEDTLTVSIKNTGLLKAGWDILCLAIDGTEIYEFYSRVEVLDGNDIMIKRPQKTGLNCVEKRRFNRVDCEIGFIGRPMLISNVSLEKSGKVFSGVIKNISAGGILIESGLCLPKDMIFSFKLKVNFFIDCVAIVRRVSEQNKDGKYEHGCEFMELDLDTVKTISLYTFKEQLKKRRQELYEDLFK